MAGSGSGDQSSRSFSGEMIAGHLGSVGLAVALPPALSCQHCTMADGSNNTHTKKDFESRQSNICVDVDGIVV